MKAERTISATEFKVNLGKYLELAADGHVLMIQKHGTVVAAVVSPNNHYQEMQGEDGGNTDLWHSISGNDHVPGVHESARPYRPNEQKMSFESFQQMNLQTDKRMEYLNGEVFLLASPGMVHQIVSGNLFLQLSQSFIGKPCRVFAAPFDVVLPRAGTSDRNVCQPDLLIACDFETQVDKKGRYTGIPSLVVEILSEATRTKDLFQKLQIYLRAGIREYWIVEPSDRSVLVYWVDEDGSEHFHLHVEEEAVVSHVFPGLCVPLTEFWRQVP